MKNDIQIESLGKFEDVYYEEQISNVVAQLLKSENSFEKIEVFQNDSHNRGVTNMGINYTGKISDITFIADNKKISSIECFKSNLNDYYYISSEY